MSIISIIPLELWKPFVSFGGKSYAFVHFFIMHFVFLLERVSSKDVTLKILGGINAYLSLWGQQRRRHCPPPFAPCTHTFHCVSAECFWSLNPQMNSAGKKQITLWFLKAQRTTEAMVNNTTARKFIFKEEIKVVQGEERYNRIYRVGQNQVKKKNPAWLQRFL